MVVVLHGANHEAHLSAPAARNRKPGAISSATATRCICSCRSRVRRRGDSTTDWTAKPARILLGASPICRFTMHEKCEAMQPSWWKPESILGRIPIDRAGADKHNLYGRVALLEIFGQIPLSFVELDNELLVSPTVSGDKMSTRRQTRFAHRRPTLLTGVSDHQPSVHSYRFQLKCLIGRNPLAGE